MLDANPVYDAPADLDFAAALAQGRHAHPLRPLRTTRPRELSHWHVPATHYLEIWGDVRAYDGTATIIQPLIAPLYDGQTAARAARRAARRAEHDRLRPGARRTGSGAGRRGGDFETLWRKAVHDGVVADYGAAGR